MNKSKISILKNFSTILLVNLIVATNLFSIDLTEGYNFGAINLYLSKQRILCYHDSGSVKSTDEYVLKHYASLFKTQPQNIINNTAKDSKTTLWMYFAIDTVITEDYIIKCLPYYKSVTLYYYTADSILKYQHVNVQVPFKDWDFKSNMFAFKLPYHTINRYFLKYEFYDSFPIGAFQIIKFQDFTNYNFSNFIVYGVLLACIGLMVCLAVLYAFVNKEIQNLYYGLYAFFFGVFTISSYHLWPLFINLELDYHAYYIYYIPFSLSSIFFAFYILKSIKVKVAENKAIYILYIILAVKIITVICPFLGIGIENLVYSIFTKLDVAIYGILTFLVIVETINKPKLNNYWLVAGLTILFTSQLLHIFYNLSHWIFVFMFFDILWFGIGLAISYRIAKEEKISALNEIISIKNTYNNELEHKVEERTEQLKQNLETIAELNNILKDNNITLLKNVETLAHDRMLNKELTLEQFKAQFPDKESCLELLSELKWKGAFECNACGNKSYFFIKKSDPYLRKCTQCGKIHSATTNTLFHNIKFPLEKAFYITFLATSNKKYSIEQIGEIISLRTATVWGFKKKVEEKMEEKKFAKNKDMTWQDLIL